MIILALSSATAQTEVALIDGPKIIFQKKWNSQADEAEKLLPALASALHKLEKFSKSNGKPDGILTISGPGSFTGLRIGVTIANTLAYSLGVPIFALTTFEYLQMRTKGVLLPQAYSVSNMLAPKKIPPTFKSKSAILLKAGGDFVALQLPSWRKHRLLHRDQIAPYLQQAGIRFLISDFKITEKKQFKLPPNVLWFPENKQKTLAEVVQDLHTKKVKFPPLKKLIKPVYLKPPTITISKKPVFV